MKKSAFQMNLKEWSDVHIAEDGEITFFYLNEKLQAEGPILEQLNFAKGMLANDTKYYVMEQLLEKIKAKDAIHTMYQK